MSLIGLLITLLVFGVVCYIIFWAMGYLVFLNPFVKW